AWAELPDGTRQALLSIPRWDFSWQDEFRLATPLPLKQGTKLAMRWLFDNSDGNPRNPRHPPERVRFGPGSWQEMCDLWVQVLPTGGDDFNRLAQVFMVKELATLRAGFEAAVAA